MAYIGVDTSLNGTGVCILHADRVQLAELSPPNLTGPVRLDWIATQFDALLEDVTIQAVAFEDGAYNAAGRVFQLGGIQHILQLNAWRRAPEMLIEVAPIQLKKYVTGSTGATKEWMVDDANTYLRTRPSPPDPITSDNLADAIGLARIARSLHLSDVSERCQAEVVVALRDGKHQRVWTHPNHQEPNES